MAQSESVAEVRVDQVLAEEPLPFHWKRNFAANFVDVMFFSVALAFASMQTIVPLYIRQLGGTPLLIGLVPALVQTGQVLPLLFAAPYVAPLRRKLPFLLKMTLIERIPWPLLAIASVFFSIEYPTVMLGLAVVLLALYGLGGGICVPAWMDIVARVTPLRMRGKLFGWSGAMSGLLGVAGGLGAERVLATYAYPYNFALCFAAASICMLLSFIALAAIREPEVTNPVPAAPVSQFIRQLPPLLRRDRDFSMFIIARILGAFGGMAVTFVAIYAVEQRGLPESLAGRFTAIMLGTQVITTPLLGMMADRRGYKPSMQFAFLTQMLAMMLSLSVTSTLGFSLVFSLIGASTGMMFSTALSMVVEFATPPERVTYLGLHGTLIAPAVLLAPIIGSWLAELGGYPLAFTAAAICGALALIIMAFFVRDPRHRQIGVAQF